MPSALIIAEYGSLNGGEKSLLAVIPELANGGWSFRCIVPTATDQSFARELKRTGVEPLPYEFVVDGRRKPLERLRLELGELISQQKPEIVHCNSLSAGRIVGPVCRELKIPSIGYFRDIIKLKRQVIADLNCLDRIVAVSDATRDWHIAQGIESHRIETIHNGVNPLEFYPAEPDKFLHRELGISVDCHLVLFVGQIGLRKGLDTWLTAAALILEPVPDAHFVVVGARHSQKAEAIEHEDSLRELVENTNLAGHVHWLGIRTDVSRIMREATVLLHCARQEPLGRVLLEAFSSGLPVVATRVGGTAEVFCEAALTPFLVPVDQPMEAAKLVTGLLQDNQARANVSQAVRDVAKVSFSIEACTEKLLAVYRGLQNRHE